MNKDYLRLLKKEPVGLSYLRLSRKQLKYFMSMSHSKEYVDAVMWLQSAIHFAHPTVMEEEWEKGKTRTYVYYYLFFNDGARYGEPSLIFSNLSSLEKYIDTMG